MKLLQYLIVGSRSPENDPQFAPLRSHGNQVAK